MPSNIVVSFAKKTGKSEKQVEKLWDKAKDSVVKSFPEVEKDSDRFFKIVTGLLKKMLKIDEDGGPTITTTSLGNISTLGGSGNFAKKVGPLFRRDTTTSASPKLKKENLEISDFKKYLEDK